MQNIKELEQIIGYTFKDKSLLTMATTHASYAKQKGNKGSNEYNERVEFLGDAILEHIISIMLYNITPALAEGVMSKKRAEIVCEKSLCSAMNDWDLAKFLKVGKCEDASKGITKPALIADMFESIMGAIYLDSNFETVNEICLKILEQNIQKVLDSDIYGEDYKTKLQELLQQNGNVKISYKLIEESGEAHDKTFSSAVYIEDIEYGRGVGKSKKESQQMAAKKGIEKYENERKKNKNRSKT